MADDDGWIEWPGRQRPPVGHDVAVYFQIRVDVRERMGKQAVKAGKLRWSHDGGAGDIIAYKRAG